MEAPEVAKVEAAIRVATVGSTAAALVAAGCGSSHRTSSRAVWTDCSQGPSTRPGRSRRSRAAARKASCSSMSWPRSEATCERHLSVRTTSVLRLMQPLHDFTFTPESVGPVSRSARRGYSHRASCLSSSDYERDSTRDPNLRLHPRTNAATNFFVRSCSVRRPDTALPPC